MFASGVWGQTARGNVTGVVRDESGAVISGAKVTLSNVDTGITVAVNAATTLTQDVTLRIGVVMESVEVVASSAAVETTSGSVGTTVQVGHVLEMPLVDRDVFRLTNLVPGAFLTDRGVSPGGGRINEAAVALDGVNNTRGGLGTQGIEISPPVDPMQEFKVEVNNLSAEYGRSTGGFVNAVTKSGTNRFNGNAYEFLRNDKLDAIGWSNDEKPALRRNNFGASVGGPIVRNRSFFFYNFDGLRERSPSVRTRNVGLPEWRQGNFSKANRDNRGQPALAPIYDPESGTGTFTTPRGTIPFSGNIIPAARFDPAAVKALAYLPAPNRPPDNPMNLAGNWQENVVDPLTTDFHIMRIDHKFSGRTNLFGRYILTYPLRDLTGYSRGFGPADPDAFLLANREQNLALNLTHLFSPVFFLNFTTGFTRVLVWRRSGDCCGTDYGREFGLASLPGGNVFPRFNFQGGLVPVTAIGKSGAGGAMAAGFSTLPSGDGRSPPSAHSAPGRRLASPCSTAQGTL
jgi:hypothetical protein